MIACCWRESLVLCNCSSWNVSNITLSPFSQQGDAAAEEKEEEEEEEADIGGMMLVVLRDCYSMIESIWIAHSVFMIAHSLNRRNGYVWRRRWWRLLMSQ